MAPEVCSIGEVMLELSRDGELYRLGFGGDTLNTALHLARFGLRSAYFTALGDDPFSRQLKRDLAAQGVDVDWVLHDPARTVGLYAISTDARGERSFTYWRADSAARRMLDLGDSEQAMAAIGGVPVLYYSLISLAILPPAGRERLLGLCAEVRSRGGKVVFDGNYRSRLWTSRDEARLWRDRALAGCDLALPTLEDEQQLTGVKTPQALAADLVGLGVGEAAIKAGADGCFDLTGAAYPPPQRIAPVDSSGAGDAFNAGFIQGWLRGLTFAACAAAGAEVAGWVIGRHGAAPDVDADAPYQRLAGRRLGG